jgi:hypothetical protein
MKTLQLKAHHRLLTIGMLNALKGLDLQSLSKVLKIVEKVELSKEEAEAIELKQDGDKLVWDASKDEEKAIELSDEQADKLKEILKKKSDDKELTITDKPLLDIYNQLDAVV